MQYNPFPHAFGTKNWRKLYESYIPDLATLRKTAKGAVLVIIDAEPWGGDFSKPAEIAMSFVPAFHDVHIGMKLPKTLKALSLTLQLDTHWIRVVERERSEKSREHHKFGQRHFIEDKQVEQTMSELIESFMQKHYGLSSFTVTSERIPLILAGFSIDFELQMLSNFYPQVLQHFTFWLDLQEIAKEVAADDTKRLTSPSLHETLFACGFEGWAQNSESKCLQHNAATDTVRAAAIFTYFMRKHGEGEGLSIRVSPRKLNPSRRYRLAPGAPGQKKLWNGMRPSPKEFYPYTAKVYRIGGCIELDTRAFLSLFSSYGPTAVGLSEGKRCGWICLPDIATLERFIQSTDGSALSDEYTWKVVSEYDSTIMPARSWEELKQNRRLALEADGEEKRAQRRAKKNEQQESSQFGVMDIYHSATFLEGNGHSSFN